jgi:chemotaxis receptor (MCP) glutamine deamidase CheD
VSDTKQAEASEREKWKALCALPQFGPTFENSDGSWKWWHELLPEVRDRILALAAENAELRAKLAAAERVVEAASEAVLFSNAIGDRNLANATRAYRAYEAATRKEPQP